MPNREEEANHAPRKLTWREKTAALLDLPAEGVAGTPKVSLTGDRELYLENYKGILAYGKEEIHVNGGPWVLRILGRDLEIKAMAGRGNADHRLGGQTRTAVRGEKAVKRWLGWLLGLVTFRVTGAQPEDFLNLCAQRNLALWRMVQQDRFTLVVQTTAHQARQLEGLAQGAGFQTEVTGRRGLPFFLWRFRKRYALLAGLVLCLVLFGVGSRTILTVDVTGNQALSAEEIIAQLRLCGVSVGTYAPSIPVREVENRMMLAMDQLTFFSLNLHGTRAEVIVREREEGPDLRPEGEPSDVVAGSGRHHHPHRALGGGCPGPRGGRGVPGGCAHLRGDGLRPHPPVHRELGDPHRPRRGKGAGPDLAHPHRPDPLNGHGKGSIPGSAPPDTPCPSWANG